MNAEYYIWLVSCLGVGNPRAHEIFNFYDNIVDFYNDCQNKEFAKGLKFTESEVKLLATTTVDDIAYVFSVYHKYRAKYVTIEDEFYPQQLRNIDNPPLILFVVGDITHLDDELLLTVVSTRNESLYGRKACELIVSELCYAGFSIVSGFANGGDTTAHQTAIKCGARTYGFLACGLDVDYPFDKADLKNDVYRNGAVITEFLPGTRPVAANFHIRNRLMSGISEGTLVIEAPKRSGTLITAHCAADQGKDVFAVPSGIFWKNCIGTIQLIQDGAKPVKDALDIIEEYIVRFPEKIKIGENKKSVKEILELSAGKVSDENSQDAVKEAEIKKKRKTAQKELKQAAKEMIKEVEQKQDSVQIMPLDLRLKACGLEGNMIALKLLALLEESNQTMDYLVEKTGLDPFELNSLLLKLEIAGIVGKATANSYELLK